MLALPVVAALSFSAAPSARSAIHSRPIFMAASGLLTGEMVPAAALSALGIDAGQRAFVAFYCRDDGFQDKKQLQDLQARTLSFAERQCVVVAVRGDGMEAVNEGTEAMYPSLRFVVDEGDRIRTMLRMNSGGVRNGDRHTYVIDADGRVQGQLNNFADPFAHALMGLRTLKAIDDTGYTAASEAVDKEAATRQAMFVKEQAEREATRARLAEENAARQQTLDRGEVPEPAANFFEGFFGAFKK